MEALRDVNVDYAGYADNISDFNPAYQKKLAEKRRARKIALKREKTIASIKVGLALACFSISLLLIIATVVGYTNLIEISSNIKLMEIDNTELESDIDFLEMELEPYISRKHIETIAKNRLGMIYPGEDNIARIKPDTDSESAGQALEEVEGSNSLLSIINNINR